MASVKEYVQSVVNAIGEVNTTLTQINAQEVPDKIRELKVQVGNKQLLGTYDGSAVEVTEAGVVDIGAMLDEGKLPLEVNVNAQSGGNDMLQARVDATNSCAYLFYYYSGDNIDFAKNLDLSKVNDTQYMFGTCKKLTKITLNGTSNVTNMSSMFSNCSSITEVQLNDTSNVTEMKYMFNNCSLLTEVQLNDTSNVTEMKYMCSGCGKLITISQLNLINIKSASSQNNIFASCSLLENIDVKNIRHNFQVSDGSSWGTKLTLDSLIGIVKELIKQDSSRTLTMGTPNLEKITNTYVKFTDSTQTTIASGTKGDVVVCESTDEGAMLLSNYATLKNWTLA